MFIYIYIIHHIHVYECFCVHMYPYAYIRTCQVGSRCSSKTPPYVYLYVFLYIYVYTYVCTHMYENTRTSICTHVHFRTCVPDGSWVQLVMYLSLYTYLYITIHTCIHTHVCKNTYISICGRQVGARCSSKTPERSSWSTGFAILYFNWLRDSWVPWFLRCFCFLFCCACMRFHVLQYVAVFWFVGFVILYFSWLRDALVPWCLRVFPVFPLPPLHSTYFHVHGGRMFSHAD